jgi:hypothetical protein
MVETQTPLFLNKNTQIFRNVFFRTSCLLLLGVKPVFVLEGRAPTLKHDTMSQRIQQRKKSRKPISSSEEENGKVFQHIRGERNRGSRSRLNSILKQVVYNIELPKYVTFGRVRKRFIIFLSIYLIFTYCSMIVAWQLIL